VVQSAICPRPPEANACGRLVAHPFQLAQAEDNPLKKCMSGSNALLQKLTHAKAASAHSKALP